MDVVKLAMLDLYCRQSLCCNSIQTSTCLDPICILMHVKLLFFAPCARTMVCAIVLTVGFMLQALIFQHIGLCNHFEMNLWYKVLLREKKNTPYP